MLCCDWMYCVMLYLDVLCYVVFGLRCLVLSCPVLDVLCYVACGLYFVVLSCAVLCCNVMCCFMLYVGFVVLC